MLAAMFFFSGATKVIWNHAFERALRSYPVALSAVQMKSVMVGLPVLELALAGLVCTRRLRTISLYAMLFLLVAFTVLQIKVKVLGLDITCGCFGRWSPPIGYRTIVTNLILVTFSVAALCSTGAEQAKEQV